ncbi:DUF4890 domain-containing protein [Saccharicrinis sp. 156]|uniref:DUF4890 domain-containing protein n=1 Tax=Saccharicrinis sp. 156 TaxID=3417574 RepID=UPI003D34670C
MKNLIFSLVAIFAITFSLEAQRPQRGNMGTPEDMAKKQTERMKEDLGLTDKQTTKIQSINLKYANKQQELRKNASGDREAMRESMKTIRDERMTELKKVLTEEQVEKLVAQEKERMQNRGQGQGRK